MVTLSKRARLRVAASFDVHQLLNRASAARFESLESRVLLCSSPAELAAIGVPSSIVQDDGHIKYADFVNLTPQQQAHINPHLVEAPLPADNAPINFDQILGIPAALSRPEGAPVPVMALPDFFPSVNGGFSIDQTSQPGRTLVRFGTQMNNMGAGPGVFISGRPGVDPIPAGAPITSWVAPDGSQNVLQAVYTYDSATNAFALDHYNASGHFTYHAGHGHFHFDGYANYQLRYRNTDGTVGAVVQRTDGTGSIGAKTGFCLINLANSFTLPNGQSSTTIPSYNGTGQPNTSCGFLQGIWVGHADIYSSSLDGQWLDVTGVPNGQYFIEMAADATNGMIESDETNNTKDFAYTLNAGNTTGGITPDLFDSGGQHNDTLATATDMGVTSTFTQTGLNIHWGYDFDYFKFLPASSGNYNITLTPASGDVNLKLFDASGVQLAASTNAGGTETITYNFVKGTTYYALGYSYNSSTSSNYQIAWGIKPTVDTFSPARTVQEENANGSYFTVARNGQTNTPLLVQLQVSGNAVAGVDYQPLPTSVMLDANSSAVNIPLIPIDNNHIDPKRTVTLTVVGQSAYVVGVGTASITIVDQDTSSTPRGGGATGVGGAALGSSSGILHARASIANDLFNDTKHNNLFADDLLAV
jgi:hypothetical protein